MYVPIGVTGKAGSHGIKTESKYILRGVGFYRTRDERFKQVATEYMYEGGKKLRRFEDYCMIL